jgi:hypothetical protein
MEYNIISRGNDTSSRHWFDSGNSIIWVVVALFVGIGLRCYFLAQPMRYDESFTFLNFVDRDLKHLFFYLRPNNHVLHSILTKATTVIWGVNPVSIRLVAFLAGTALIPLIYYFCRTIGQSGVFASIATAVFPYFVSYSTNARGYTLLVLFALFLALIGVRIVEKPSTLKVAIFSVIAAFGMLTMPSMLFPISGIYLWVIFLLNVKGYSKKYIFYTFAFPSAMISSVLTIVVYIPVILVSNGIEPIVANKFVKAQPWSEFISQICPHFQQSFIDFTRDIPGVLSVTAIMLVAIGIYGSVKQRNWPIIFILPSLIFMSILILFIKQKIPFARTWIYIIPFFILVADSGFTYITAMVSDNIQYLLKIATFCIAVFIAISLMSKNAISSYNDTGAFAEAEILVKYLKPIISTNDVLHVRTPADWPTYFYLRYHNVPQIREDENPELRREYFVVQKGQYSIGEMTNKQYITLFSIGDLTLYQAVGEDSH